jgi:hypothetical protein
METLTICMVVGSLAVNFGNDLLPDPEDKVAISII